jgi:uncharacterized membrane protein
MESVTSPLASELPRAAAGPAVRNTRQRGTTALRAASVFWYVVTVAGQLMFAVYISVLYGGAVLQGNMAKFSSVMPKGYVTGDTIGNATIVTHLALAVVLILGGALQLVPVIRRRVPRLHRYVGRSYITAATLTSIGGMYLVWVRGTVGDLSQHLGSTLNAAAIITCGVFAWRAARARDFGRHRRWALRLFLVASGVWFFRVGLMLWLLIFRRPVGFDGKTFTGPFLTALTLGETLVPLLVLQWYLWAESREGAAGRTTMAVALVLLTCAMAVGLFGATMGMWLPHLR